jgi:dTDP-4-amino-4,6-dideoxygalactose transaminase
VVRILVRADFENAVAKYLGMVGSVATSNGTIALLLALKALDISHGDEVIIPLRIGK